MEVGEARRLKALEEENARLNRLVADQALDNQMLKDLLRKNGWRLQIAARLCAICRRARWCRSAGGADSGTWDAPRSARAAIHARMLACASGWAPWRERGRFGYRRLKVLLARAGRVVNHKRVDRVSREEAWALRRPKRQRVALSRPTVLPASSAPKQRWSLDFVSDALGDGRRMRLLTVVATVTRDALALEVETSLPSNQVIRVRDRLSAERGARPREMVLDNGPELTSRLLDQWAVRQQLHRGFIEPGKPMQNVPNESVTGRLRDACLNQPWFASLADARRVLASWQADDTGRRPHRALGYRTPRQFHLDVTRSTADRLSLVGVS
jgi:putative transposase